LPAKNSGKLQQARPAESTRKIDGVGGPGATPPPQSVLRPGKIDSTIKLVRAQAGCVPSPQFPNPTAVRRQRYQQPATTRARNRPMIANRLTRFVARLGILAIVLAGTAANAAPLPIREAWVVPGNWVTIWLQKKDLAKHYGQSYVLVPQHYVGTPPMITALANNEVDIAAPTFSTLGIAIDNAGISDLRIIADEFQDGVPGWYAQGFMVLKDGPIHQISDLKGKVIATNVVGSAVDIAMRAMLLKHGLVINRDYTEIEAPFPAMTSMLAEKKVDLIPAVIPFSYNPALTKIARTLFTQKQAIGVTDMVVWAARKPFIDAHRAALIDFFEDTLRIVHWYLDPKNHQAAMQIMANLTHRPPETFSYAFTGADDYHPPNLMPNLPALQNGVDLTAKLGFTKTSIDVKHYADLSLIEAAAKRLESK
jgi:sulfonate transport system substrate-binding protein